NYDGKIAYEDIVAATEDFDFQYCIEVGGYGSVFSENLPCGKVVALKKLHRLEVENPTFDKRSLFCNLRDEVEAVEMDWKKRVKIIKGVAHALSYLHYNCCPSTVHQDISSNNVLLNSSFEAFVADIGTAKMLDLDSSSQSIIVGAVEKIVIFGNFETYSEL
ncbi:hypothetical protein Gotri_025414, partial [Gossypium trilobum]|nr:hypothetical protein [Gossypium trilobum]